MEDKQRRMGELVALLNRAAYAYYTKDEPIMADVQYDRLYDELLSLEKETGVQMADSPTHRVGGETLKEFEKYRHVTRLWSMDKVQSEPELLDWVARAQRLCAQAGDFPEPVFGVEYKFDGLTINLTYENGVLVQAATRGDGRSHPAPGAHHPRYPAAHSLYGSAGGAGRVHHAPVRAGKI